MDHEWDGIEENVRREGLESNEHLFGKKKHADLME